MTRSFAMAAVSLVANIGYGATLLGSEAAGLEYARAAAADRPTIIWSQETGRYVGSVTAKCGLAARHDCRGVLFVEGPNAMDRGPSRVPGLEFANGPAVPVVNPYGGNPYSGTFVTFPLR